MFVYYGIKIFRLLILLFSLYGWYYYLAVCKKIKDEFVPSIIIFIIGSIMFFSGILNILELSSVIICATGCGFALLSCIKRINPIRLISPAICFLILASIILIFYLYGRKFTGIDSFHHWATVVYSILDNGRFPNFKDALIIFQSYPVGSASFIYYICNIISIRSEWMLMYIQAVAIVSCLLPLFAFAKNTLYRLISAGVIVFFIMGANTSLADLSVDTLLPAVAASGILFCIYYGRNLSVYHWVLIFNAIFLVSIKNSGWFFAVILIVIAVTKLKSNWKKLVGIVLSPVMTFLLWQRHVALVFDNGLMTKHSLTISNFENSLQGKTVSDVCEISLLYIKKVISFDNSFVFYIVLGIIVYVATKNISKTFAVFKKTVISVAFIYILYHISLLATYVFSMPLSEALKLASYERYHMSILIYILLITLPSVMQIECHSLQKKVIFTFTLIILSFLILKPYSEEYSRFPINWKNSERYKCEKVAKEGDLPKHSSYIILHETVQIYPLSFYQYFYLQSNQIKAYYLNATGSYPGLDAIGDTWKNYEYLIVYDDSKEIWDFVHNSLGIDSNDNVILLEEWK